MLKQDSIPKKRIFCFVWKNAIPHRDINSKWYVTYEEYAENLYPDYCGGFFFLMTNDIIDPLHKEMFYTKFFWIDDVWLTGIAIKELNFTLECRKDVIAELNIENSNSIKQIIGVHLGNKTDKITELWDYLNYLYFNSNYLKKSNHVNINLEIHSQFLLIIFILIYLLFLNSIIKIRNLNI